MERHRQPDRRAVVVVPRDCAVTKSQCSCAPRSTRYILTASTFTFPPMTGAATPQRNQGEATIRSGHDPAAAPIGVVGAPRAAGRSGTPRVPSVVDSRLGRQEPRDVLRLVLSDRSPRTAGTPAPRRPAARTARAAFGRVGEGARMSRDRARRQDPQPLRQPVQSLRYMGRFSARSIGRPLTALCTNACSGDARSALPGPSPPPGRG